MTNTVYPLKNVSRLEITILVDNYVDALLPNQPGVVRPVLVKDGKIMPETLIAEHGLSLLIDTWEGATRHRIVLDTGYNPGTMMHNMKVLDLDPREIEAVVLSHGHMDHTGCLNMLLETIGRPVPVFCHPDVFRKRFSNRPNIGLSLVPQLANRDQIIERGAQLSEQRSPILLAGNTVLASGEIPRVTPFENGTPGAMIENQGRLEIDKIQDDQCLVIRLDNCGLVVISGCAHAGIVNSILYARKLTGEDKVYGVIGGFHLTGADMAPTINPTIEELKNLTPEMLAPMHCTGHSAMIRFYSEFPDSFVLSSVGTRLVLPR